MKIKENEKFIYETLSAQILREDNLINQRQTWSLALNAAFLAAIGVIYAQGADELPKDFIAYSCVLLSVIALMISISHFFAVRAAQNQIEYLFMFYAKNEKKFKNKNWPRPFGDSSFHFRSKSYAYSIPFGWISLWVFILLWFLISSVYGAAI